MLVMTLLVRDEEDIIRENIEFHLAQGVDFIIATDNLSKDGTTDILHSFEQQGVLKYLFEESDDYNQHAWVTRMARMASIEYKADWIINNDADEFWWPIYGSLKTTFESIPNEFNTLLAQRSDFIALDYLNEKPFFTEMVYRKKESLNALGKLLPPKVAHRGHPEIIVRQGNHAVQGFESNHPLKGLIDILHFPLRSREQFINKIVTGGSAYEKNIELSENVGKTWRNLYKDYKSNKLASFLSQNIVDQEEIDRQMTTGDLFLDSRLKKYFQKNIS